MLTPMRRTVQLAQRLCTPALALLIYAWPAIAFAQQAPPSPSLRRTPPVWLGLLVMFALLVAIMTVSLLPSKRSHLD
jgi:hypothetical protein